MIGGTVRIRALRGTVAGVGRELAAGEVAALDAVTAEVLVSLGAAVLLDERDAPKLREAFLADQRRQQLALEMSDRGTQGTPWRKIGRIAP